MKIRLNQPVRVSTKFAGTMHEYPAGYECEAEEKIMSDGSKRICIDGDIISPGVFEIIE